MKSRKINNQYLEKGFTLGGFILLIVIIFASISIIHHLATDGNLFIYAPSAADKYRERRELEDINIVLGTYKIVDYQNQLKSEQLSKPITLAEYIEQELEVTSTITNEEGIIYITMRASNNIYQIKNNQDITIVKRGYEK